MLVLVNVAQLLLYGMRHVSYIIGKITRIREAVEVAENFASTFAYTEL